MIGRIIHRYQSMGTGKRTLALLLSALLFLGVAGTLPADAETTGMMTDDDFWDINADVYMHTWSDIPYVNLLVDIVSTTYLANMDFIDKDLERIIEEYCIEDKPDHIANWNRLAGELYSYNEQAIQADWKAGKKDASMLKDPAFLFFDEQDKNTIHDLFVKYVDAYDLTPGTLGSGKAAEFHAVVTQLCTEEANASFGIRLIAADLICKQFTGFLHDYLEANYATTQPELIKQYYDEEALKENSYVLKDYVAPVDGSENEFMFIVSLDQSETLLIKEILSQLPTD